MRKRFIGRAVKRRTDTEKDRNGRHREGALSEIIALRQRIATSRAGTFADAAVQLRRLAIEAETEGPSLRGLLAGPDMRGLVASVLAVISPKPARQGLWIASRSATAP